MRRDQANHGSKPVRNVYTNPGFETVGGTVTVRTNLAMDPHATNLSHWSNIGSGPYTRAIDSTVFKSGTTSYKTTLTSAGSGNIGAKGSLSGGVTSGETVSWTLWVYSSVAITGNAYWERSSPSYSGAAVSGNYTVPADTWTLITGAYTFNASQADPGGAFGFGFYSAAGVPTGSVLYADELQIEKTPLAGLSPFFSGATAAAGDFTYSWAGTANASASLQRATDGAHLSQRYYCAPISSTDWAASGSRSLRIIPNTVTTESFVSLQGTFVNLGPLIPGNTYTALATLRLPAPLTGSLHSRALNMVWRQDGVRISQAVGTNVAGVQQMRLKFTVSPSAVGAFIELFNGASAGGGDVWWDNVTIVEGDYTGDHVDGTKLFSKWDGAANASSSVGYPPQLTDIAGKPALENIGIGNTASTPVDGFIARTIYICYEVTDSSSAWAVPFRYGSNTPTDGFTFQTNAAGLTSMSPRFDFTSGGGDANKGATMSNARTPVRRHVVAVALNQGLTQASYTNNGNVSTVQALNPGTVGLISGTLLNSVAAGVKAVHSMVYYAEHDATTRQAISRYLGNKYGALIA